MFHRRRDGGPAAEARRVGRIWTEETERFTSVIPAEAGIQSWCRGWTPAFAGVTGTLLLALAAPAAAQDDLHELVAACRDNTGGLPDDGRVCRSMEQLVLDLGSVCRQVPSGMPELCAPFYGEVIASAEVDAYQATWEHRALGLQRALDAPLPLRDAFFPSTHNSYNSSAYTPTLSGLDMNHHYSLFDQLRMDIRGIELDVHWFPSASGDPAAQGQAPILCHGTGPHAGCTLERHMVEGLREVKAFLDLPGNADEVVVIDFELHLDGDPVAHAALLQAIADAGLADEGYGPRDHAGSCGDGIPLESSRDDIRAAGRRLVIYGGCRGDVPGWDDLFHSQNGRSQSGMPSSFAPFPDCDRAGTDRHLWTRHWEDTTWLSAMAGASTAPIDGPTLRKLTDCTLNMPSLDKLTPNDGRLAEFVWSWEVGFPAGSEAACALVNAAGRFEDADCGLTRPHACLDASGDWFVAGDGAWADGPALCAASDGTFAVPRTGYDMNRLLATRPAGLEVWVDYSTADGVDWTATP